MKKKIVVVDNVKYLMVFNETTKVWDMKGIATDADIQEVEGAKGVADQIAEGVKAGVAKFKQETEEKIAGQAKTITELTEKVAKIEKMEIPGLAAKVALGDEMFMGYNLKYQGMGIREKILGRKELFPTLSDEAKMRGLSKWAIQVAKALASRDFNNKELKDLSTNVEGTSDLGGYIVPPEYAPELLRLAREMSVLMKEVTVVSMGSNKLLFPKEDQLVSAYVVDEAGTGTPSQPKFGQMVLEAVKIMALTAPISLELIADAQFDLASLLLEQIMYAFARKGDDLILNGDGAQTPKFVGLLPSITSHVLTLAVGKVQFSDFTADDLSALQDYLTADDDSKAKYVLNKKLMHYVRTLKDSVGNYIFAKPGDASMPATVWGSPIVKSPDMPKDDTASKKFLLYGNLKEYYFGVRQGQISLDVDATTGFANGTVRFRSHVRYAGNVARENAFAVIKTGAAQ